MRTLVLGEALVDLICERPVAALAEADGFARHFGGAAANVAVQAARRGGEVELAGGVGDDPWGAWLRERLAAEGVGLRWFGLVPGCRTPVAFVWVDGAGEPSYLIHGEGLRAVAAAVGGVVEEAVDSCGAICLGSNSLVGEAERALTLAAREHAAQRGLPVLFDPNLRLHRWPTASRAVEECLAVVRGAFLVKCNRDEARLLSGEQDVEAAAAGLRAAGARHVVVTLGADGALLRGEGGLRRDVPGLPARPVSTVGAGDACMGVLVAALSRSGGYPPALAAALPEAVAVAARVTERWSAL